MSDPSRFISKVARHTAAVLLAVAALAVPVVMTSARAVEITVYTVRSILIHAPDGATEIHLDAADAIETKLSSELPSDPARAVAVARERLQKGGDDLQRGLAAAYEHVAQAWSLGITTLPAVVVDRRYVVYGETDAAKAIARIEAYRRAQP